MESCHQPITQDALLQHAAFVERLALLLVGPAAAADAADLVQETYLTVLRRRPAEPERLRAWLRTVMFGLVRSGRRRSHRQREVEEFAAGGEAVEEGETPLERLEIQQLVVSSVLALPEQYRSALVQRYYANLSHARIAETEGIALETVTTRLRRAKDLLRERLEREPTVRGSLQRALAPILPPPARSHRVPWITGLALTAAATVVGVVLLVRGCSAPVAVPPARHPLDQDLEYRFETNLASLGQVVTYAGPDGTTNVDLNLEVEVNQELTVSDRILETAPDGVRLERTFDRLRSRSRTHGTFGVAGKSSPIESTHEHVGRLEGERRTLDVAAIDQASLRMDGLVAEPSLAIGDAWTIEPGAIAALLAPLDLLPPPSAMTESDTAQGTRRHGPEQWFSPATEGAVGAGVTGFRTVDGERLADIALDVALGDRIDLLRPNDPLVVPADASVRMSAMVAGARFEGHGTLVWNLDRGRAVSLEINGTLTLDVSLDAIIRADGGDARVTRTSRLEGNARLSITSN